MQRVFLILYILLVFTLHLNAQKNNNPSSLELIQVNLLDTSDIVETFRFGRGFEGLLLDIKPNGTYKTRSFSCDGYLPYDSGTWEINGSQLILSKLNYELFRYGKMYFLVLVKEKEDFKKDILQAIRRAKHDPDKELSFIGKVYWGMRNDYFQSD